MWRVKDKGKWQECDRSNILANCFSKSLFFVTLTLNLKNKLEALAKENFMKPVYKHVGQQISVCGDEII